MTLQNNACPLTKPQLPRAHRQDRLGGLLVMQKALLITERKLRAGRGALRAIDFCSWHRYATPARSPLAVDQRWHF
jgi:hypothetical protein